MSPSTDTKQEPLHPDDLRNPAYDGPMGIFAGYGEYCQCGVYLKTEKEQRDGVCRACL